MSKVATPRPALEVLQAQQKELVDHSENDLTGLGCSLRHGFQSRRDLIVWYQAAVVRTFGELAETFEPRYLARDRSLLQGCIVGDRRKRWTTDDPLSLADASRFRRGLEQYALMPATNRAYNSLRKMAGEYVGQEDREIPKDMETEGQEIAMRPAFSRKDLEQREALNRLWDGFATEDRLRDWLHDLDQPTNGALPSEFPRRVMADRVSVRHLVRGPVPAEQARVWRETLAIAKLLPAFVEGVQRMDAGELAKRTSGGLEDPPG